MAEDFGDKTELPSDRRRQEVRERGNIAKSVDLNTAASVLAATAVLQFLGGSVSTSLADLMHISLAEPAWTHIDTGLLFKTFSRILELLGSSVLPFLATLVLSAVAVNLAQVGFVFTTEPLFPNFGRLNPLEGVKRVLSLSGVVKLLGSLLKLVILVSIVGGFIASHLPSLVRTVDLEAAAFSRQLGSELIVMSFQVALALMILAVLDYGYMWWKFEQDIKMTKEEVREEMKTMEGDPHIRQRRREAHRKLSESRQVSQVKTADVVVTNPTEIAVAIKYDAQKMAAPIVVAKGAELLADRIRRIAIENGIPIIEKKPLARALYHDVKVGQAVPIEFYEAIAEILAYVYRLSGKAGKFR
jgi:flagellar biosynthetic protein FlhB